MSKNLIIGIAALLLIGGGAYYLVSKSKANPAQSTGASQPQASIFSSIQDALAKSLTLECSFTDQTGHQTKSFIKNGAVRADITAADPKQSGSVIIKDKKMYFWNNQGGFMMDVSSISPAPGASGNSAVTNPSGLSANGMLATMEQYKNSCKPSVVSDNLFTPPTNVNFQDLSKMMQPSAPGMGGSGVPQQNNSGY